MTRPVYMETRAKGLMKEKIAAAHALMEKCSLCPRACKAGRKKGQTGYCGAGGRLEISDFCPHFGEEPALSGTNGSGTVFFTHCSLRCIFCQNHDISIKGKGQAAEKGQLASIMLELQRAGCHNINLVTPGHFLPFILEELDIAAENGLDIPLVYNSSGYESIEALKILDGIVDIYMPDFKFWDAGIAEKACNAPDYPETAKKAIMEMFRQRGNLKINSDGTAVSGLLVRHLVLPENLADTEKIMNFLSEKISLSTSVNIMSQYRPMYMAGQIPELARPVSVEEYRTALNTAKNLGLDIIHY